MLHNSQNLRSNMGFYAARLFFSFFLFFVHFCVFALTKKEEKVPEDVYTDFTANKEG